MNAITTIVTDYHTWLAKKQREHHLTDQQLTALIDCHPSLMAALTRWWDITDSTDATTARGLARTLCQAWVAVLKASKEPHPAQIPQDTAAFFQMHSTRIDDVITVFPATDAAQQAWAASPTQATYSAPEIAILQELQAAQRLAPEKLHMLHQAKGIFGATLRPLTEVPLPLPDPKETAYDTGDDCDHTD